MRVSSYKKIWVGLIMACLLMGGPGLGFAQFYNDSTSEDDFFENDDLFFGSGEDEFGITREDDFTEGDQYVDESLLGPGTSITPGGRRLELRMLGEREMLPLNGAWGAGTGLLIGGWFALISQGNNRETQRSLGMGIVIGAIIGVTVGLKSVISPDSPSALGYNTLPAASPSSWEPLVYWKNNLPRLGFNLRF